MIRPEFIVERLRRYMPDADMEMVWRAYAFAARCHRGQKRVSGEPYLSHPLEVANILTEMKLGHVSVATGLLHDTVEDGDTTMNDIVSLFGAEVASLVDGVTKISLLQFSTREEQQAENMRKMILAMSKDIRVILIKLADRVHNMRTLGFLKPEKQRRVARETMDLYAPLANRLGIGWIKTELENSAFLYLHPHEYADIKTRVERAAGEREEYIGKIMAEVRARLETEGLKGVEVMGRPKHYYSIFAKMRRQKISFDEVFDLMGVRVITNTKPECYAVLGMLHSMYKPIPGKLDDYIALPKENMYQSLHTTIVGQQGKPVEFQIRTHTMHLINEEGIAAHWRYKEGAAKEGKHDEQILWLRRLLEWQKDVKDPREFLEYVKIDLFPDEVYVFTPNQDVKALPLGGTPIDFAYAIHTDVGNHCVGAKVNGKLASLRHELKNGDIVEILTSAQQKPHRDWLKFVKTSKARTKIASFIRMEEKSRAMELGRELLEKELLKLGLNPQVYLDEKKVLPTAQASGYMSTEGLYIALGVGKAKAAHAVARLAPKEAAAARDKAGSLATALKKLILRAPAAVPGTAVRVQGVDDVLIRMAGCCNPVPGDAILGFISRGRGLIIHTADCPSASGIDPERRVSVEWSLPEKEKEKRRHRVALVAEIEDKPGMLHEVSGVMAHNNVNIHEARSEPTTGGKAAITMTLEVADLGQLQNIMNAVKRTPGVLNVERLRNRRGAAGKQPKKPS